MIRQRTIVALTTLCLTTFAAQGKEFKCESPEVIDEVFFQFSCGNDGATCRKWGLDVSTASEFWHLSDETVVQACLAHLSTSYPHLNRSDDKFREFLCNISQNSKRADQRLAEHIESYATSYDESTRRYKCTLAMKYPFSEYPEFAAHKVAEIFLTDPESSAIFRKHIIEDKWELFESLYDGQLALYIASASDQQGATMEFTVRPDANKNGFSVVRGNFTELHE